MKLPEVFGKLERFLGPGTGDLSMRFGLHSGQVTAGVLRGERVRRIQGDFRSNLHTYFSSWHI